MKLYRKTGEQFRPTFDPPIRRLSWLERGIVLALLAAIVLYIVDRWRWLRWFSWQ